MPRNKDIKKVLVIGSGPIIIGQAAEFDYAGTQACRSLKEEGIEVVLLNSNPATIMTDKDIADRVYIEPLTVEVVEQLILKEKPDSVLPTLGGQAGLNLAMELDEKGFLKEHNIRLIGTTAQTIKKAEDRQEFKDTMEKIGEPIAASKVVTTVEDGLAFTNIIGYPVVLRPAYTLGGSGGGIAHNEYELREILENGLRLSRVGEVLVERCIAGWKEIEYEVMRDGAGNCITVCNMENIDPVGVHTGDSIVVAPSQTLGDKEYQMLRTSALNIISELNITGGCNVQYALHPETFEYCVIEVNPRVSRSSALASKATGYPIAKVAAKIALGYTLDEIPNAITGKTYASFEPMLDYCVVKIPRLPFDKFLTAKRTLSTQMKATGEVMSICDNFEGALMKAIRSLEQHVDSLMSYDFTGLSDEELEAQLHVVDDRRIWVIAEALRRGVSYDHIYEITKIDRWFIDKLAILVEMEQHLKSEELTVDLLKEAKRIEFPDNVIAELTGKTEEEIKQMRYANGIVAAYKMVDTCAAEFAAETPYYYSVYGSENEAAETTPQKKVLVLGSGPIRIGQGIEFDYCSVHCVWTLKEMGCEAIICNNNPETVSTDFDTGDRLYFDPLTKEDVANIITKYGLIALPIVDHENCMVGIVTVDDAMQVLQDETTEDISIMAGVNPNEDSYFGTSIFEHVKSRIPWLLFLMLSATVTQMIMNSYENALALMPQLAGFVPMLTGTGGNCGSQSSTLVIRGLAVGEIEFSDLFKVIWKEIRIAFCISIILSVVNGIRIMLMGQGDAMMAFTIGLTMACTVLIAKVVGCTLPLIAKKIGLDPAIMATPLISTLVDISTISVYFAIVSYVFHL